MPLLDSVTGGEHPIQDLLGSARSDAGSVTGGATNLGSVTSGQSDTVVPVANTVETPVAHTAGGPDASFTNASVEGALQNPQPVSDSGVVSGPAANQSPALVPVDVLSFTDESHPTAPVSVLAGPSSLGNLVDGDVASGSYGQSNPVDLNVGPDWNHAPLVQAMVLTDSGTSVSVDTQDLTNAAFNTSGSGLLSNFSGETGTAQDAGNMALNTTGEDLLSDLTGELSVTHAIGHGIV